MLGSLSDLKTSNRSAMSSSSAAAPRTDARACAGQDRQVGAAARSRRRQAHQGLAGILPRRADRQGGASSTDNYRVRAIGGTSRIWGGRAIPFDPIDFEKRDWVPGSGWPLRPRRTRRPLCNGDGRRRGGPARILPGRRPARRAEESSPRSSTATSCRRPSSASASRPTPGAATGPNSAAWRMSGSSRTRRSSASACRSTATGWRRSRSQSRTARASPCAVDPTSWRSADWRRRA